MKSLVDDLEYPYQQFLGNILEKMFKVPRVTLKFEYHTDHR